MIKAIVTDIEGTTSSISFVHDVLFPYARKHMAEFVRCHAEDMHIAPYLNDVRHEVGEELDLDGVINQLILWIDQDKKITPLKALQGLIWEKGYKNADFHGHVYADAYQNLKKWHEAGIKLYVYSSGSVYAQKLLFGHTEYGDLNALFSGNFDTQIGAKTQADAYRKILKEIGLAGDEVLFLSDIEKELAAATEAGMKTFWLVRDAAVLQNTTYSQAKSFNDITL